MVVYADYEYHSLSLQKLEQSFAVTHWRGGWWIFQASYKHN